MAIRVQVEAFDPGAELNALHAANLGIGAVVGFVGYVRDFNEGREVGGMFLEHFPGMTEKSLGKIAEEAGQRWPLLNIEIIHRVGRLEPGVRRPRRDQPFGLRQRRRHNLRHRRHADPQKFGRSRSRLRLSRRCLQHRCRLYGGIGIGS